MKNANLITAMQNAPIELVQEFYSEYGFTPEVREDNGDTNMSKNCQFTAKYFAPAKGSGMTEGTEPDWRMTDNGKEYCIVMGYAKVKGFPFADKLQKCILNKKSYDNGDFELSTMYSSVCHIPMLDAEGNKHTEFNDIFFVVFENVATNNDMGDLVANEFEAFMAKKNK